MCAVRSWRPNAASEQHSNEFELRSSAFLVAPSFLPSLALARHFPFLNSCRLSLALSSFACFFIMMPISQDE